MSDQQKNWIKTSERQPTQSEYPIWLTNGVDVIHSIYPPSPMSTTTHWQRATVPAPPPKEQTQEQKDNEAANRFVASGQGDKGESGRQDRSICFLAGLAHARKEVAELIMAAHSGNNNGTFYVSRENADVIRALLGIK